MRIRTANYIVNMVALFFCKSSWSARSWVGNGIVLERAPLSLNNRAYCSHRNIWMLFMDASRNPINRTKLKNASPRTWGELTSRHCNTLKTKLSLVKAILKSGDNKKSILGKTVSVSRVEAADFLRPTVTVLTRSFRLTMSETVDQHEMRRTVQRFMICVDLYGLLTRATQPQLKVTGSKLLHRFCSYQSTDKINNKHRKTTSGM